MTKTVKTLQKHLWTLAKTDNRVYPATHTSLATAVNDVWSVTYGNNLPDWKARIREGRNASTLLQGTRTLRYVSSGTARMKQASGTVYFDGPLMAQHCVDNGVACSSATISKATTDAAVAFTKHFRKNTEQWRSGEFLGTIVQTARLVHEPALLLRRGIDGLYHDVLKALRKAGGVGIPAALLRRRQREAVAEAWLVWSYGIMPTVQDLNDACTAARALASNQHNFDLIRLKGEGHAEATLNSGGDLTTNTANLGDIGLGYSRMDIEVANVTYRGAWKVGTASGELPVPQHFGLKWNEVIPTAYQLLPWSFFYDYFSNLGDVLDAWNVALVDFAWLNRTTRSRRTAMFSDNYLRSPKPSFVQELDVRGGRAKVHRYDVLREPMASLLDARFRIDLQIPSLKRLLNIAALAQMAHHRPKL